MSTTIGRDHVVNLVTGNRRPFAVQFDFVVVANHATLGRATIHQVAARTLAVISFEVRVEALMPFIVACPVISVLRRCAYTKKHGEPAPEKRDELALSHANSGIQAHIFNLQTIARRDPAVWANSPGATGLNAGVPSTCFSLMHASSEAGIAWLAAHDLTASPAFLSCHSAMVITAANDFVGEVHDRISVVLEPGQFEPWLSRKAGVEFLKPAANDVLEKWPVSKRVNKIGIDDDATLIDQISLP